MVARHSTDLAFSIFFSYYVHVNDPNMRVNLRSLPDMRLLKAFALFLPFFTGIAQPQIIPDYPAIVFIPPEVYLSVAVRCGGIMRWDVKKENIRIRDDGRELGVTNIWIPDTTARHCCISAALVADRSESMQSRKNGGVEIESRIQNSESRIRETE